MKAYFIKKRNEAEQRIGKWRVVVAAENIIMACTIARHALECDDPLDCDDISSFGEIGHRVLSGQVPGFLNSMKDDTSNTFFDRVLCNSDFIAYTRQSKIDAFLTQCD